MSNKKTIADLRIDDVVYTMSVGDYPVITKREISSIKRNCLGFYGYGEFIYASEDKTAWKTYDKNIVLFTELKDALLERRVRLDKKMEFLFDELRKKQNEILELNKTIRENDQEISRL